MTPITTATPYCTAAQLLVWCDWRAVADYSSDPTDPTDDRPPKSDLTNPATDAGAVVAAHLLGASGELETACLAGGRYRPADLQALTGAGATYLQRLVALLAVWSLQQRRHPEAADPEKSPGAAGAVAVLEMIRRGERILPFGEAQAAGGAADATPLYDPITEPTGGRATTRAGRLFDTRSASDGR